MKPGDWGAVTDAPLKGFTLNAFSVPGRAAPKPDPAEVRIADLERRMKQAEAAHQEALRRAAREAEEAARAAEAKGREEGHREGEKAALEKYEKSLEGLRKGIKGVLEALSAEKAALFLTYEGEAVALAAAAVKRVFEGIGESQAEAVLPLLRKAVAALGEASTLTLRIHPADFQVIDAERGFWLPLEAGLKDVRIAADDRIPRGGCLVESDSTSVEMRAAQLADRIGEEFAKVFEAKSVALRNGKGDDSGAGAPFGRASGGDAEDMPPAVSGGKSP